MIKMFHFEKNNQKGGTALKPFRPEGNRRVALFIEKHEQLTPNGREPSSLVLMNKILAVFCQDENKDYKSKLYVRLSRNAELIIIVIFSL